MQNSRNIFIVYLIGVTRTIFFEQGSNYKKSVLFDTEKIFIRFAQNYLMLAIIKTILFLKKYIKHQMEFILLTFVYLII